MKLIDTLVIVPARGGSKGVSGKNIKPLNGVPLIHYTLDVALQLVDTEHICVSTDDAQITATVRNYGIDPPFVRPADLSGDTASMWDVLRHAVKFYANLGREYKTVILLQPTSPFRTSSEIVEAVEEFTRKRMQMMVSVKITDSNPYYVLFEEDDAGFLLPSKKGDFDRRQDCPPVYELNGSFYIIDVQTLMTLGRNEIKEVGKFVMSSEQSIDIDTHHDWRVAEVYAKLASDLN